jgi:AcrR family transcriptional regulator
VSSGQSYPEPGLDGGARRAEILRAATTRFGRDGYEDTRWADIAADIGLGPTALYYYFESKQHCLFVILDEALAHFRSRFDALTTGTDDHEAALAAILRDCFDLDEIGVQRNRVFVAELSRLSAGRPGDTLAELARRAARERGRRLELAWREFLASAMHAGAIAPADPRLLTRAIFGLYNSVWHWYRDRGLVSLPDAAEFFTSRAMAMTR